jgi:hypothetical protein
MAHTQDAVDDVIVLSSGRVNLKKIHTQETEMFWNKNL